MTAFQAPDNCPTLTLVVDNTARDGFAEVADVFECKGGVIDADISFDMPGTAPTDSVSVTFTYMLGEFAWHEVRVALGYTGNEDDAIGEFNNAVCPDWTVERYADVTELDAADYYACAPL